MKTQGREPIKTARFSAIVDAAGQPDVHVLLTAPENDKVLQSAIKQNRVMTVEQGRNRGKVDRGSIGFSPGQSRQFLIFPKSLARFAGSSVVAIKYDLLKQGDARVPSRSFWKAPATKKKEDKTAGQQENSAVIAGEDHSVHEPCPATPSGASQTSRGSSERAAKGHRFFDARATWSCSRSS